MTQLRSIVTTCLAGHELKCRAEQARGARRGIGTHRHRKHRQPVLTGMDQCLDRVGKAGHHVDREGGLARIGAKARHRVLHVKPGQPAHDPASQALQQPLGRGKGRVGAGVAVPQHDIRAALDDGAHEIGDGTAAILVVAIGIDNDIGPCGDGVLDPGLKAARQPLVALLAQDVVHAEPSGDLDGVIGRAVIHDLDFDRADPLDLARDSGQDRRQRALLVQAGDLDDEFQRTRACCGGRSGRSGRVHVGRAVEMSIGESHRPFRNSADAAHWSRRADTPIEIRRNRAA